MTPVGEPGPILITAGKLERGDYFVCGSTYGKVRAMIDFNGQTVDKASPSTPIEILSIQNVYVSVQYQY